LSLALLGLAILGGRMRPHQTANQRA